MKLENVDKVTVSDSTKGWVRQIVELDELENNVRHRVVAQLDSEEAADKELAKDYEHFKAIRLHFIQMLGMNVYENITDICSTQI